MKTKHPRIHTNFLKFLKEKYEEIQELPEEETNCSDEELVDEYDKLVGYGNENDEVQDKEETTENDEESVDDLIKEYLSLKRKHKAKTNGIRNKRK